MEPDDDSDMDEPTEEELERIIAEQMQCLPPWWDAEVRRQRQWLSWDEAEKED
jgi:hypothetical protein